MKKVLSYYDTWSVKYEVKFYNFHKLMGNRPEDMEYRALLKGIFNDTTHYFRGLSLKHQEVSSNRSNQLSPFGSSHIAVYANHRGVSRDKRNFYAQLVSSHVTVNATSLNEADTRIAAGQKRNDGRVGRGMWDNIFAERAFIYADNVPKVVEEMQQRGFAKNEVENAWWTLVLRGQVWAMSNCRVGETFWNVPSHYHNSPTRIYIL